MKCEHVQERLSELIDGELSAEMRSECQSHLAVCSDCQCEHRAFLAVGQLMVKAAGSPASAGDWGRLASRLDQSLVSPASGPAARPRSRLLFGAIVALAASALAMVATAWRSDSGTRTPAAIVASDAVIDWREFIDGRSSQPQVALRRLSEKFAGREASLTEAEGLLGYTPAVNRALADDGIQLVSTRTLRLPECACPDGGCRCASGGCNSSVSLCKRNDGSQFLLIEHCACQKISFGGLIVKPDAAGARKYGIVKAENRLAATWLLANRRLVAIGLNDGNEARSLVEGTVEL